MVLDQELNTPQILHPSRKKWILTGVIFTFLSFFMLMMIFSSFIEPDEKIGTYFGLLIVLLLTVASFLMTSKKATYFKITNTGFEQSIFYKKKTFLWKDITQFGIHIILNGKPIIGFNVREGFQDHSFFMKTTSGKLFDKMFHFKYQLQGTYGFTSDEFLNHLNFLLQKFKV